MNARSRRGLALLLALLLSISALTACGDKEDPDKEQEHPITVILESDNHQVSPEEFNVYQYQAGLAALCNHYWYCQYGLVADTDKITATYDSAYAYAYAMLPQALKEETFASVAYTYAEQYIVYCEGALAAGMDQKLSAEVDDQVSQYITELKETAKEQGLSLKTFIQKYMGESVGEDAVRSAMKRQFLANAYAEIKQEELSASLTQEELTAYREENKSAFYKAYYHSYQFSDPVLIEALEKAFSIEKLQSTLTAYVLEQTFSDAYKAQMTDMSIEDPYGEAHTLNAVHDTLLSLLGIQDPESGEDYRQHFTESNTDAYGRAAYRIVQSIQNELNTELRNIKTNLSASYIDLSDPSADAAANVKEKWLFSQGRREGDWNILSYPNGSYEWCLVSDPFAVDGQLTRNLCYVRFSNEEAYTAEEKANAFLYAFMDSKSPEKFNELAIKLEVIAPDTTALHECVTKESLNSASPRLSQWLFDDVRAVGDAAVIDDGNTYYVAYYVLENEANWMRQARAELSDIRLQIWYNETHSAAHLKAHVDPSEWETASEGGSVILPGMGDFNINPSFKEFPTRNDAFAVVTPQS